MLAEWFASGLIVEMALGLVVAEAILLLSVRRFLGRGPATGDWLPNLVSGASLLLALRLAIAQSAWHWIAAALSLSLAAHLADLARRFRPE